jgi:hypothetical protein
MDIESEEQELARLIAEMRALDRDAYYDQDIVDRIDQARIVLELDRVDPLVWSDDGIGVDVSDVFCDASFEIRRLRREIRRLHQEADADPAASVIKPEILAVIAARIDAELDRRRKLRGIDVALP